MTIPLRQWRFEATDIPGGRFVPLDNCASNGRHFMTWGTHCPVCGSVEICTHAMPPDYGPRLSKLAEAENDQRDRYPVWFCVTCVCLVGVLFFAAIWGLSAAIRAIGG